MPYCCRLYRTLALPLLLAACVVCCTYSSEQPQLEGRDVRLTLLHTSDIHSRIYPFDYVPMYTEERLGMVPDRGPYGGLARLAYVIGRERSRAGRVLHLDAGDLFQGAPVFNLFHGEPELRAMDAIGLDAFALGNHEFDMGAANVARQFEQWAGFPVLAANYRFEAEANPDADAFNTLVKPFTVFDLQGLKVGVIGLGNLSSMTSLEEGGNSLGILPLATLQIVQDYVSMLRDQVDVIVLLSHLGLTADEQVAHNVCGLDIILGGHLHVALLPPKLLRYDPDPALVDDLCDCPAGQRRDVLLAHSQAFSKFVGRLDVVVRDKRVVAHKYELIPIDSTLPDDPEVYELLEPYYEEMLRVYDLDRVIATADIDLRRFGGRGGDSMLGNLVAEAIRLRRGVETDFSLTNSLGVRTDIQAGPIDLETMFNTLPFDNTITTMYLSGREVQELFDYSTARSAIRGCTSQVQISNAAFKMNCRTNRAEEVYIAGRPLQPDAIYELATNDYLAWGGSGFDVLKRNTTKIDTGIAMRDAVIDYMREHPRLPECFDQVEDVTRCRRGIAVEDGRITTVH